MGSSLDPAILESLPHRPPFLFVDRVVERDGERIVTEWHVPADLDVFRGHYPGTPILPGVLQCEFAFQSAALLVGSEPGRVPLVTRIEDARFRSLVRPGATLRAELVLTDRLANARWVEARLSSAGRRVLEVRFCVALAEPPAADGELGP